MRSAPGVDHLHIGGEGAEVRLVGDIDDHAPGDQHRSGAVVACSRVHEARIDQGCGAAHLSFSSRAASDVRTAMRAATPIST
jgi:hypothetical protein